MRGAPKLLASPAAEQGYSEAKPVQAARESEAEAVYP